MFLPRPCVLSHHPSSATQRCPFPFAPNFGTHLIPVLPLDSPFSLPGFGVCHHFLSHSFFFFLSPLTTPTLLTGTWDPPLAGKHERGAVSLFFSQIHAHCALVLMNMKRLATPTLVHFFFSFPLSFTDWFFLFYSHPLLLTPSSCVAIAASPPHHTSPLATHCPLLCVLSPCVTPHLMSPPFLHRP